MSRVPPLDMRDAVWDRMRGAVVAPAGRYQLVITGDALEAYVNRTLSPQDAVEVAQDEQALLRTVANTLGAQDGVITITNATLNGRDWSVQDHDADAEAAETGLAEARMAEAVG